MLEKKTADVVKTLMKLGVMANATQSLEADTAQLVAEELGHKVNIVKDDDILEEIKDYQDDDKLMSSRPPVVTIMGFSLAGLFGGSLIVEILYGIPGVGRISLDSVYSRDYPVIMAIVLLGSSALVVANLIIDFVYTLVDPRIEMQ